MLGAKSSAGQGPKTEACQVHDCRSPTSLISCLFPRIQYHGYPNVCLGHMHASGTPVRGPHSPRIQTARSQQAMKAGPSSTLGQECEKEMHGEQEKDTDAPARSQPGPNTTFPIRQRRINLP